jgi:hypothetical protein
MSGKLPNSVNTSSSNPKDTPVPLSASSSQSSVVNVTSLRKRNNSVKRDASKQKIHHGNALEGSQESDSESVRDDAGRSAMKPSSVAVTATTAVAAAAFMNGAKNKSSSSGKTLDSSEKPNGHVKFKTEDETQTPQNTDSPSKTGKKLASATKDS